MHLCEADTLLPPDRYAHQRTIKWTLTSLPPTVMRASYDNSGWTTFEKSVAGIISKQCNMLVLNENACTQLDARLADKHASEIDQDEYLNITLEHMDSDRGPPRTPMVFNHDIQDKVFTNGADRDEIVIPKYAETFEDVISSAQYLEFECLGFEDDDARQVMELAHQYHTKVPFKSMKLGANKIKVPLEEWASLADELQLEELDLNSNPVPGDLRCLDNLADLQKLYLNETMVQGDIEALHCMANLMDLKLHNCSEVIGDIKVFSPLTKLEKLGLQGTRVYGDIQGLQNLRKLKKLDLTATRVHGSLSAVEALSKLSMLYITKSADVQGDLQLLTKLVHLKKLDLSETAVAGNIRHLQPLTGLQKLHLKGCRDITGKIANLMHMEKMERIDLDGTSITGDATALLKRRSDSPLEPVV